MLAPLPGFARSAYDAYHQHGTLPENLTTKVPLTPDQATAARDQIQLSWSYYTREDEGQFDQFPGQKGEVKLNAYGIHGGRIGNSYASYTDSEMLTMSADPLMADDSFASVRVLRSTGGGLEALTIGTEKSQFVHVDANGQTGYILMEPSREKPLDPRFFASAEKQALAPKAFALQPAALPFLQAHDSSADRVALTAALREGVPDLHNFDQLSWQDKIPVLQRVFDIECKTLGITPPELILSTDAPAAFFEFNLDKPDPGKVFINPQKNEGFDALLLLVHETRHSKQFQQAFGLIEGADPAVAEGFREAFKAQKELSGKLSFVDFCTLLNEYEAFQFANSVVGTLTDGQADTKGMGTLASQFDAQGALRVNLKELFTQVGPDGVLDAFNELERPHYDELYGRSTRKCC